MPIVDSNSTESGEQNSLRDQVVELIKKDYEFSLLSVLPGLENRLYEIRRIATKLNLEKETREEFIDLMVKSGFWSLSEDGKSVSCEFDVLDFGDLSVVDFLSMTVSLITRLQNDPASEFETLTLVSSKNLVRNFLKDLNKSLKTLYEESKALESGKDCVFSWTHTGVLEYQVNRRFAISEGEEG